MAHRLHPGPPFMDALDWGTIAAACAGVFGTAYYVLTAVGGSRMARVSRGGGAASGVLRARDAGGRASHLATTPAMPVLELARVEYEEDDEIDPTRIGAHGNRVRHDRISPPLQKIVYDEDAATTEPTQAEDLFLVSATAQTDKGLRRKQNEDSLLVSSDAHVYVVADGMGGYRGGAVASQLAVKTVDEAFRARSFEGAAHDGVPREATELARAIQMANDAILEAAETSIDLHGMGTTVCAARFTPNKRRLFVAHVGDSRCYRLREGTLRQMTADHTMEGLGVGGPAAAHLSRAVGVWPTVPIDVVMAVPEPGDLYLLCSDGLTKMIPDDVIAAILASEPEPKAAVERLVAKANERGGRDNITVVLVRVVDPKQPGAMRHDNPRSGASAASV